MKSLFNIFKYVGIGCGLSTIDVQYQYAIDNVVTFDIIYRVENEETSWEINAEDFSGEYPKSIGNFIIPTQLKMNLSDDEIYKISKEYNWDIPIKFYTDNPQYFPTITQMESELRKLNIFRKIVILFMSTKSGKD